MLGGADLREDRQGKAGGLRGRGKAQRVRDRFNRVVLTHEAPGFVSENGKLHAVKEGMSIREVPFQRDRVHERMRRGVGAGFLYQGHGRMGVSQGGFYQADRPSRCRSHGRPRYGSCSAILLHLGGMSRGFELDGPTACEKQGERDERDNLHGIIAS